jgi:hypothetical protein
MSWEALRLFGCGQVVLGPHGAGLSNILFSAPGTTVIEFLFMADPPLMFWHTAEALGQRYWMVPVPQAYWMQEEMEVGSSRRAWQHFLYRWDLAVSVYPDVRADEKGASALWTSLKKWKLYLLNNIVLPAAISCCLPELICSNWQAMAVSLRGRIDAADRRPGNSNPLLHRAELNLPAICG